MKYVFCKTLLIETMKVYLRLVAQVTLVLILAFTSVDAADHSKNKHEGMDVLEVLLEGNKRFVDGVSIHPHQDKKTILENAKGQNPFAVIVACSDSRVPVETLFDAGIGDIFVIRTAGNIIGKFELGSIQYAVEHLGVKFVGIMGHTDCGAIKAYAHGHLGDGCIKDIIEHIKAEQEEIEIPEPKQEHLDMCIYANIFHGLKQVSNDSLIQNINAKHGIIEVLPMIYHVESGVVEVIDSNMKSPH